MHTNTTLPTPMCTPPTYIATQTHLHSLPTFAPPSSHSPPLPPTHTHTRLLPPRHAGFLTAFGRDSDITLPLHYLLPATQCLSPPRTPHKFPPPTVPITHHCHHIATRGERDHLPPLPACPSPNSQKDGLKAVHHHCPQCPSHTWAQGSHFPFAPVLGRWGCLTPHTTPHAPAHALLPTHLHTTFLPAPYTIPHHTHCTTSLHAHRGRIFKTSYLFSITNRHQCFIYNAAK